MMGNNEARTYVSNILDNLQRQKIRKLQIIEAEHEALSQIEVDINAYNLALENMPNVSVKETIVGGGVVG